MIHIRCIFVLNKLTLSNFKFDIDMVRIWVFKVALLFSVFLFSGFSPEIQSQIQRSEKTELVELRIQNSSCFHKTNFSAKIEIFNFGLLSNFGVGQFVILHRLQKILVVKFKSYSSIILLNYTSSSRALLRVQSSSSYEEPLS